MGHPVDAHAVQRVQVLGRQRVLGRAVGEHAAVLQQHDAIADLPRELQIVRGDEQRQAALVGEAAQQLRDLDLVVEVEGRRRLVEDQQTAFVAAVVVELRQRARRSPPAVSRRR